MDQYRHALYEKYASEVQSTPEGSDLAVTQRWFRAYRYYLRDWLPASREARILDLACGNGTLLKFLRELGYGHLSAVDISPEQVQLARGVIPDVNQGDVLDFLKDRTGDADLIFALDIVEHLHKDEVLEFLSGCYAALTPGGRLILQTPNAMSPWGLGLRYGDLTHENSFTPQLLTQLLARCGFRDMQAREQGPIPWGYGWKSTVRYACWQLIRSALAVWNVIETGNTAGGVYSRVFLIVGRK
jgi:2-polyprenyl-3-methyl-5-hydroxy-6-metoxy-1,4-benzoquinol methylase